MPFISRKLYGESFAKRPVCRPLGMKMQLRARPNASPFSSVSLLTVDGPIRRV